jgi:hypothetical protein
VVDILSFETKQEECTNTSSSTPLFTHQHNPKFGVTALESAPHYFF